MASISERENREVEAANASGNVPVVFIHGLWLLPSSWEAWAVLGHSTGGLLAQMLAARGLSAATVAIDPGVFRGVLPLPASVLRGVGSFLVNPLTRGRAITLTFDQFKYGWANALDEKEAKELYDTFHVAGSGIAVVQMGNAHLNPWTEAKVNTKNQAAVRC
jgi:non-heme chloroperoxidase